MAAGTYTPDDLLTGIAPCLVNPFFKIAGYHIFCFNQVEKAETWRHEALAELMQKATA